MLMDLGLMHSAYWIGECLGSLLSALIFEGKDNKRQLRIASQVMCMLSSVLFIYATYGIESGEGNPYIISEPL